MVWRQWLLRDALDDLLLHSMIILLTFRTVSVSKESRRTTVIWKRNRHNATKSQKCCSHVIPRPSDAILLIPSSISLLLSLGVHRPPVIARGDGQGHSLVCGRQGQDQEGHPDFQFDQQDYHCRRCADLSSETGRKDVSPVLLSPVRHLQCTLTSSIHRGQAKTATDGHTLVPRERSYSAQIKQKAAYGLGWSTSR